MDVGLDEMMWGAAADDSAVGEAAAARGRLVLKHCLQRTGRPCVGLNGTVVEIPHSEHSVRVSVREIPAAAGPPSGLTACVLRRLLHGLQRFGSFLNCLSRKKSCSPAVKTNSLPQSAQVKSRSTISMPLLPSFRNRIFSIAQRAENFDPVSIRYFGARVVCTVRRREARCEAEPFQCEAGLKRRVGWVNLAGRRSC